MEPINICPHCLRVVPNFEKDYHKSEIKAVNVDTINQNCGLLLTNHVLNSAKPSGVQNLRTHAGQIAKDLGLNDIEKKEVFRKIKSIKQSNPKLKDHIVLNRAFNCLAGV